MNTSLSVMRFIRYVIAYVFIISGSLKLFSEELASSFIRLGLPYPDIMLYVVSFLEIICGIFIAANRSVKNACIPLIAIMIAALLLTKIPTIHTDLLQFAFNARLDIVMLVLLVIVYTNATN